MLDITLEQKKHQKEYFKAKNRYENAAYEKRRAENGIIDIRNREPQVINKINELSAERKCNLTSLEEISKSVKTNGSFDQSISDTEYSYVVEDIIFATESNDIILLEIYENETF